uniref:Large ribosomal subunit protein uL23c n=1 Tax=Nitella hyalina TaxID=181804 RepID=A0A2H4G396_NITHY|nr:ribosomal protein L23 [Nitella hyalina]
MDKIKKPILTEKSISLLGKRQYTFEVDINVTKWQAKKWMEKHFKIRIRSIKSYYVPIKNKKNKTNIGKRKRRKRMIFNLQVGNSIPISSIN